MGSFKPPNRTPGLQVHVIDLPEQAVWQETIARLHQLTLLGLGDDVANVRVDLEACDTPAADGGDIACRLTVRLRRSRRSLNVETRHPDGTFAVMQAFTRAQREAQREMDSARRTARRHLLGDS